MSWFKGDTLEHDLMDHALLLHSRALQFVMQNLVSIHEYYMTVSYVGV